MTARPTSPSTARDIRAASSTGSRRPGQLFFKHFGENIFRNDLCNADVDLGDLLIHEGPAVEAQRYAAKVFGADKTYFVLNGTSTSNKIVANAVLKRGDLVLFDRNNHKSLHQGALVQAGAIPIFLPTARNAFGMIGAVDWDAWDEDYLREQIRANPLVKDPERHEAERPFRLACIQLATYDGTVYNVRKVLEKIGHLCDYVLWDEAWIGYNAFHPLFEDHSPMRWRSSGRRWRVCSPPSPFTSRGPASRRLRRSTSATQHIRGQRRYRRAQAVQRILPDERLDVAVLSAVRLDRDEREGARRQGRRDALGPLHRARHRMPQEASRVLPFLRGERARARRRNGSSTRSCPTR